MSGEEFATLLEHCGDDVDQLALFLMIQDDMWLEDCTVPALVFHKEDVEYAATSFHMADVLDIAWSACRNNLN